MVKIFFATPVKRSELALYLFSLFNYYPSLIDWPTNWLFCAKCKLLYVELPIYRKVYRQRNMQGIYKKFELRVSA